MKLRIAAICAIVAFATCGDRAPAQFPGCAHLSIEIQAECQPEAREWYVVNDRTDGQVEVTIHVTLLDVVSGVSTSTDQVLTLAAGRATKARMCSYRDADAIQLDSCRLSATLMAAPVHSPRGLKRII